MKINTPPKSPSNVPPHGKDSAAKPSVSSQGSKEQMQKVSHRATKVAFPRIPFLPSGAAAPLAGRVKVGAPPEEEVHLPPLGGKPKK